MDTWKRFTSEELSIARNASITNIARALGFTPVKMGQTWTTLKEHDSVIIKNDRSYSRNSVTTSSGKKEGGTAIDFVKNFTGNHNLVEVVQYICELEGYSRKLSNVEKGSLHKKMESREKSTGYGGDAPGEKKAFLLPPKADNNRLLYSYLMNQRKLDASTVNYFVKNRYIYQSRETSVRKDKEGHILTDSDGKPLLSCHDNLIIKGLNVQGKAESADKRGMMDTYSMRYKGKVPGSDATCGFNVSFPNRKELCIFEAAIDLMSYCEIYNDFEETSKLSLGTVSDGALERYLKEHENIEHLKFCLDADYAGLKAACMHACKYLGYTAHVEYIEKEKKIDMEEVGEDVVVYFLHPDKEVNANKELKESDTYYMKFVLDVTTKLESRTKYSASYVIPEYGKDFNESIQHMKSQGMSAPDMGRHRRQGM
ncbi:toprim domain-containing protein [Lachnospiraceae bacterium 38-14]|nr:toprim domain-containing protein [Lachnospiraceae bacterium]